MIAIYLFLTAVIIFSNNIHIITIAIITILAILTMQIINHYKKENNNHTKGVK